MKIHIVAKGDTLWKIANKYNIDLDDLIKANPQIQNPDSLVVGSKLIIPNGGMSMEPKHPTKEPMPPKMPEMPETPEPPEEPMEMPQMPQMPQMQMPYCPPYYMPYQMPYEPMNYYHMPMPYEPCPRIPHCPHPMDYQRWDYNPYTMPYQQPYQMPHHQMPHQPYQMPYQSPYQSPYQMPYQSPYENWMNMPMDRYGYEYERPMEPYVRSSMINEADDDEDIPYPKQKGNE